MKGSRGSRYTYWWSRIPSSSATPFPSPDMAFAPRDGTERNRQICTREIAPQLPRDCDTRHPFHLFLLQVAANFDSSPFLPDSIRLVMCHVSLMTEWMVVDRSVDICLILRIRFFFAFGAF